MLSERAAKLKWSPEATVSFQLSEGWVNKSSQSLMTLHNPSSHEGRMPIVKIQDGGPDAVPVRTPSPAKADK